MSVLVKTRLTLKDKHQETSDVVSFRFKSAEIKTWRPGQYLHYTLEHPHPDGRGKERDFTISSAPFEGHIQITTRLSDHGSSFKRTLRGLVVGGDIEAEGPEGDFVIEDPSRRLVFIAGGIGVTPYRSMLLALDHAGIAVDVDLLFADRDGDFPFKGELELLAQRHAAFRIHYFTGGRRLDEKAIRAAVGDVDKPVFYVSGPEPMVESFEKLLLRMSVSKLHLKTDYFPGYPWP
ncbi:MAG TPA: FAD-dependent oxidoreductase [Elusimicrobiota bacterium]|jgi:ferredoxin-NADP reductase|nr:FAD-dependent oxidoreductase [Elusimicrobiota bacterium]